MIMINKTDAEILVNAPDGAIGINMHGGYMYHAKGVRSLADIEALVAKDKRIAELGSALSMALNACYELDSHGVISENVNYARALELLKGVDL